MKEPGPTPSPHTAWYTPSPIIKRHNNVTYQWVDARIKGMCKYIYAGSQMYIYVQALMHTGVAMVMTEPPNTNGFQEEREAEGNCWEVYIVWYDGWGNVVWEDFVGTIGEGCFVT